MSIINIVVEKNRALIGFDTLAGFMSGAEQHFSKAEQQNQHTSKVSFFPHLDAAMTHRGDALLGIYASLGMRRALVRDFDQACEIMPAIIKQAEIDAIADRTETLGIATFEGAEAILVGWSNKKTCFDATRWHRYPDDAEYTCSSVVGSILLPATHDTPVMPFPTSDSTMEDVARHQVEWVRREYPSYPVGGRLMIAELSRGSLNVRTIADLEKPPIARVGN